MEYVVTLRGTCPSLDDSRLLVRNTAQALKQPQREPDACRIAQPTLFTFRFILASFCNQLTTATSPYPGLNLPNNNYSTHC
ncbi:hypothetical protein V8C40DRAFT_172193 [Trichoderma camerunense]